jgi:acetylornithine/N-succinyldiaminopimelate aminotransferase
MTNESVVSRPPLPRQYGDELLVFDHGEGSRLVDIAGRSYLDMGSGIAVNALGYGRSDLAEIAANQMRKLIHVSNLFATPPQLELAKKIISAAIPGDSHASFEAVHFGNSGAEANETAMKYARLYALNRRGRGHHRFIAFSNGFHGRTMGALSVTANPAYREPFNPLIPDSLILPFNDIKALENQLDETVAAVIIEPIQGEGGLNILSGAFAKALNGLCRKYDVLLISDEVQTGMGRCGAMFASGLVGLEPDIITLAKPLAGGLPLSAVLVPAVVNALLKPGHHATTFGGGPVTTAVASAVWDILSDPAFLAEIRRKGELLETLLASGLESIGVAGEVRGAGLLRGLRLNDASYDGAWCSAVIAAARDSGLIILKTGSDVLRLAPPLVINDDEIAEGVTILFDIIRKKLTKNKG